YVFCTGHSWPVVWFRLAGGSGQNGRWLDMDLILVSLLAPGRVDAPRARDEAARFQGVQMPPERALGYVHLGREARLTRPAVAVVVREVGQTYEHHLQVGRYVQAERPADEHDAHVSGLSVIK